MKLRLIGTVALLAAVVAAFTSAAWLLPAWVVQRDEITGEAARVQDLASIRQSILWIGGGTLAIITLAFTWRRDSIAKSSVAVDRDANYTNRYTEAVKQLGDESSIAIRLGGVYALERIARDSYRDRITILDVLAAYLRVNSRREDTDDGSGVSREMSVDLAAAALVLARISRNLPSPHEIDLARCDLTGVDVRRAGFASVDLSGANLTRANLSEADLRHVNLAGADLTGADLSDADLTCADLTNAVFRDANVVGANLVGAEIKGATFEKANLDWVKVQGEEFIAEVRALGADIASGWASPGLKGQADMIWRAREGLAWPPVRGHKWELP